jgi:5-methylcytosine-specific restriction endonuclease McrA
MKRRQKRRQEGDSCITVQRAMTLTLSNKASILEGDEAKPFRSETLWMDSPIVCLLNYHVHVPYRREMVPNRYAVLVRDDHVCAYCGGVATSMDHIVPRSRGGQHVWLNLIASCFSCNFAKDSRTLKELGWTLGFQPRVPSRAEMVMLGYRTRPEAWDRWTGV